MNNDNLTKSIFAALLLVSTVVSAEDKYPASDFKPKVVFQDEAVAKESESSSTAKAAPAVSTSAASGSTDSRYPAANFEPKVVFSDSDYKHTAASPGPSNSSSATSSQAGSSTSGGESTPAVAKEESSIGYLLGLVVLAIAGFVLFKKGAGSVTPKSRAAYSNQGGLTGVAKYMLKVSGTGVSRYLEKNAKSVTAGAANNSATGVAKYLASQDTSSTATASKAAATGVEKYMRNKG